MESLRLGGLGMKHIKKCSTCKTEKETKEFYNNSASSDGLDSKCKVCRTESNARLNPKHNPNNNPQRMFVNGKYIPKSHPLYKPGNYRTFEDAAFDALSKYTSSTEGQVYIITNKAWEGWIKVGMAIDSEDRCNQYQTSSPFRDYTLQYKKFFTDRRKAEQIAHSLCNKKAQDRNGEWFKLDIPTAISCIEKIIIEEQHEKETA